MSEAYGKQVEFFLVYIREAHPTDGWQVKQNERENILVAQPKSLPEREQVAAQMCAKLKINLPTLIDGLDDKAAKDFSAWPDRLYLVGKDGAIAYKGAPGPGGFKPEDLERAILRLLLEP